MTPAAGARRPNWLLRGLIIVSLLVHLAILLQVSGLIRVRAWSKIEVSLAQGQPPARALPRPRPRPPETREPQAVNPLEVPRPQPMLVQPREVSALQAAPGGPGEAIADGEAVAALPSGGLAPPSLASTRADVDIYHELVRGRIERHKTYPTLARQRQQEGRVTLRFTIDAKGGLASLKVARSSGVPSLDQAASDAVRQAAPFPPPPGGALGMELAIAFELN